MAKTGASRGRTTRQSRRLNPDIVVEEENASPDGQTKDKQEEDQKVVEDNPKTEEAKGESDTKLATGDVQDEQPESGPVAVETEDQAKDEPEGARTVVEDKPETEEEPVEMTSTDIQSHSELSLKEEIKDGGEEQVETTSTDIQSHPEVSLQEEIKDGGEEQVETTSTDVQAHAEVTLLEKIKDDGDAEMEAVIEVKGSAPTVSVSWKEDEQPEEVKTGAEDLTRTNNAEISNEEQVEVTSTTDVHEDAEVPLIEEIEDEKELEKAPDTEIVLVESDEEPLEEKDSEVEIIEDQQMEEAEDKEDVEMESSAIEENDSEKTEPVKESDGEEEDDRNKEAAVQTKRKRKAKPSIDSSPSKKVKLINDGYCLYVGNLDNSKYYEEIRNALEKYFMTQSLLVQDIRLDKAKKHAFVDVASQLDLTKALTLNGQKLLNKPLKIAKAKVKEVDLVKKKKDPQEVQKAKNERCLHVENIPSTATKEDLLKVFPKATAVRFLGGTDSPKKGIAFVDFQSKNQADAARGQSGTVKIQDCVLRVNVVRESAGVHRIISQSKNKTKGDALPSNTLFVRNLPAKVQEKQLRMIFKKAVKINIPLRDGISRGFAFVEFASVAHAQKALKSSKNSSIEKRRLKVQFGLNSKTEQAQASSKTLIVLGLHENTKADTLTEAFEGALTSRIFVDKDTGLSKKFGFVDFESADSCRRAKEAAEDVEIDGSTVTVAFARPKHSQAMDSGERGLHRGGKKGHKPGKGRRAGRPLLKKSKVSSKN